MDGLTEVEIYWQKGRVERWIQFGQITQERIIDRYRRIVSFSPGSIFSYVRRAANDHGTIASRIDILRAAQPGTAISTVPCVRPGGEILLRLAGWPKVERVLKASDAIKNSASIPRTWRRPIGAIFITGFPLERALAATVKSIILLGSFGERSKDEAAQSHSRFNACGHTAHDRSRSNQLAA